MVVSKPSLADAYVYIVDYQQYSTLKGTTDRLTSV